MGDSGWLEDGQLSCHEVGAVERDHVGSIRLRKGGAGNEEAGATAEDDVGSVKPFGQRERDARSIISVVDQLTEQ